MAHKQIKNSLKVVLGSVAVVLALMSCSPESAGNGATVQQDDPGRKLFNKKCSICHGRNGNKQLSGAKKLTQSKLEIEKIEAMVTNGLRQMPAFSDQLTAEEIKLVSNYAYSFRTKQD